MACNLEITREYHKQQLDNRIMFICGSTIGLPFKDNSFDVVVLNAVLHHLVGRARKECMRNAEAAIEEVMRVLRTGGVLIVDENFVKFKLSAKILWWFTKVVSKIPVECPYFDIRKGILIHFYTPLEIEQFVGKNVRVVKKYLNDWSEERPLRFKLTLIYWHIGCYLLIAEKECGGGNGGS